jgi:hypothetical protein
MAALGRGLQLDGRNSSPLIDFLDALDFVLSRMFLGKWSFRELALQEIIFTFRVGQLQIEGVDFIVF